MDASNPVKSMLWVQDHRDAPLSVEAHGGKGLYKIVFCCIFATLIPYLVPMPYNWDVGNVIMLSQAACMAFLATRLCPYSRLRLKSLLAAFTAFSVLDVVLYPVRFLMAPYIVYACEVVTAFIFLLYIHNKWYNSRSEPLDDEHLFLVSKRVSNLKELILSMVCDNPQGGFSIYAGGEWYHYRKTRGVIEKTSGEVLKSLASNYVVQSLRLANIHDINRLESMVGLKWTPFKNCITEFKSFDRG